MKEILDADLCVLTMEPIKYFRYSSPRIVEKPYRVVASSIDFPITYGSEEELLEILRGFDELHVYVHYSLECSLGRLVVAEYPPYETGVHLVFGRRGDAWHFVYYVTASGSWGRWMAELLRRYAESGGEIVFHGVLFGAYVDDAFTATEIYTASYKDIAEVIDRYPFIKVTSLAFVADVRVGEVEGICRCEEYLGGVRRGGAGYGRRVRLRVLAPMIRGGSVELVATQWVADAILRGRRVTRVSAWRREPSGDYDVAAVYSVKTGARNPYRAVIAPAPMELYSG